MTRGRLYFLVLVFTLAGYGLVFYNVRVEQSNRPIQTLCLIKTVTKQPCPSCGTTRSVTQIAMGNFKDAALTNPLGFLAAFLLVFSPLLALADWIQRKSRLFILYRKLEDLFRIRSFAIIAILLVLANWIWNIYKGI